jgi:hypothetical protein
MLAPNHIKKFNWTHQLLRNEFKNRHDVVYYGEGYPGYIKDKPVKEIIKSSKKNFDVIVTHSTKCAEQFTGLGEITDIPKVHIVVDYFPHSSSGDFKRNHVLFERDKYDIYMAPYMHEIISLKANGYKNSFYFPHCVDIKKYTNHNVKKIYDIFAVFSLRDDCYPDRRSVLKMIWDMSDKVRAFTSKVYRSEYVRRINQSKLCLGNNDIFSSTNIRVFEILACGGFLLTDEAEDFKILGFKDGINLATYENLYELEDKIFFYLKNESLMQKISKKGYELVINNHTTENRVKTFEEILYANGVSASK